MTLDDFTMELRLCDDDGYVSRMPSERDPAYTYLDQHNSLASHSGHEPVVNPFHCTGSAHLAAEHIRCTSPAHDKPAEESSVPPCT